MSPDPFPHERVWSGHERVWSGHETTTTTPQNGDYRHKPRFHHPCIDKYIERTSLRSYLVASAPSTGVSDVCETKNVPLQIRNEESMCEMRSFNGGPLLSS